MNLISISSSSFFSFSSTSTLSFSFLSPSTGDLLILVHLSNPLFPPIIICLTFFYPFFSIITSISARLIPFVFLPYYVPTCSLWGFIFLSVSLIYKSIHLFCFPTLLSNSNTNLTHNYSFYYPFLLLLLYPTHPLLSIVLTFYLLSSPFFSDFT